MAHSIDQLNPKKEYLFNGGFNPGCLAGLSRSTLTEPADPARPTLPSRCPSPQSFFQNLPSGKITVLVR